MDGKSDWARDNPLVWRRGMSLFLVLVIYKAQGSMSDVFGGLDLSKVALAFLFGR